MDAPHGHWLNVSRKSLTANAQECCELYWTNPGSNIQQNNSCTTTKLPSLKSSKSDWKGGVRTNSFATFSSRPHHTDDQLDTYLPQLFCMDTRCSLEDLSNAMDDKDEWRGRIRGICASGMTWYIYIYIIWGENPVGRGIKIECSIDCYWRMIILGLRIYQNPKRAEPKKIYIK